MGGELVTVGKSLLEVAKAAARLEQLEQLEQHPQFPSFAHPTWIEGLNAEKTEETLEKSSSQIGSILRKEVLSQPATSLSSTDEQAFVAQLKDILSRPADLSKEVFLRLLEPHLRRLKSKPGRSSKQLEAKVSSEGSEEESILRLLKECSRFLGQSGVSILLQCAVALNFWAIISVLLEKKVVVSSSCSVLVQRLVEEEQPLLLCKYTSSVPDLTPRDIHLMLSFFLDSVDNPSKPFQLVRSEWKSVARAEIEKAAKNRDAMMQKSQDGSVLPKMEKVTRDPGYFVSAAIGVAMAVDGFSAPEYCIHHLLAAGQDEAVLSSVISRLSIAQALNLTKYLVKWIERYSGYLQSFPTSRSDRVPSLVQVLNWTGVLLEGHFTTVVLSADFHSELRQMRSLVQSLVAQSSSSLPLSGIVEHIKSQRLLPSRTQQGVRDSDYVIELLDMS